MNQENLIEQEPVRESNIKRLPFKDLMKRIGPGIILAGIVMGPGAITTASMVGAMYGYSLLWIMIPIAFMGISFLLTTYRVSLLTGMPALHAIRHYFGPWAAQIVGITTFLSCVFFTIGNISGTGAGMNLLFGIDWKLGAMIMLAFLVYCYFSKGVYSKVEKISMLCVIGLILAFYATIFQTGGPDLDELAYGLSHWTFPVGSLALVLGFISTNASITTALYGTYLSKEKKWKKDDLFNGGMLADSIAHIVGVILVSGAIVLVGAIVLFPNQVVINSPAQLADMLVPFMGRAASIVMGLALVACAFSSLLGNTHRSIVLLNAGFNKPAGLEEKSVRWGSLVVLIISAIVSFSYGGSPIQLIYLANIATAVAAPFGGLFMCLLLYNKEVNKGLKKPKLLQVCMTISYLFSLVLIAFVVVDIIQKMFS
ncbi:Nramp family divalent metal transporter [Oceanobacillus timonensis]|uniref:Nramp family divalent metal transporter n=1 Tax=Oceanobacillus timonensis TaxID=1926285 RepID=UPI0009B981D6|nr:Nramp family divalent metal transporter [Oceanobacillus timonensis]